MKSKLGLLTLSAMLVGAFVMMSPVAIGQVDDGTKFDRELCYEDCRETYPSEDRLARRLLMDCMMECDKTFWRKFDRETDTK